MAALTAIISARPPWIWPKPPRLPPGTVLERLSVTRAGLSTSQADERRRTVGPNVLVTHRVTALGVFLRQLRNPLLILLLAAATVSGATGDPTEAAIIAAIVLLSFGFGLCERVPLRARRRGLTDKTGTLTDGAITLPWAWRCRSSPATTAPWPRQSAAPLDSPLSLC